MSEKSVKHWFIALKKRGQDVMDLTGLEMSIDREHGYYADPFLLDGHLFFENYDHTKGIISCMNLKTGKIQDVLEEPWHLSYPCVFRDNSEYYMVPEAGLSGEVSLYRAKRFPDQWEKVHTLVGHIMYGDPQIFHYKNKWYLFLTQSGDNNLIVYRADDLMGDWKWFTQVQDWNQRSAGNIFEYEGKVLRPVQDCTQLYGGAIVFKELEINESTVVEKVYSRIDPTWFPNLIGTHTFNFDNNYVVLDGKITLSSKEDPNGA